MTLAPREWATTSDEFQRYLEDYLENFSEHGVAQADDIAMGSTTEQRHANDLSLSSTPSTTGATTLTGPISVNASTTGSTVQASPLATKASNTPGPSPGPRRRGLSRTRKCPSP